MAKTAAVPPSLTLDDLADVLLLLGHRAYATANAPNPFLPEPSELLTHIGGFHTVMRHCADAATRLNATAPDMADIYRTALGHTATAHQFLAAALTDSLKGSNAGLPVDIYGRCVQRALIALADARQAAWTAAVHLRTAAQQLPGPAPDTRAPARPGRRR